MLEHALWTDARDLLLEKAAPVGKEYVSLEDCPGRVLGFDLQARADVPPFDRSPYDGYALRSADTAGADRDHPVTLRVTQTLQAGRPGVPVRPGEAARIMTGALIPEGADCVVMYEKTVFTPETVTLFAETQPGENVVRRGEDTPAGALLAAKGMIIDAGLAGTLAAQGLAKIQVYRRPVIGLLSTGTELVEPGEKLGPGQIYDANRASFTALLFREGCETRFLGRAGDDAETIRERIASALQSCDAVIVTGGVSVGDWDLTPEAMTRARAEILVRGVDMKPGMACAFGIAEGKLILGLSGNPASSMTNFCACALPAIRKTRGMLKVLPQTIRATLKRDFPKKSPAERFLRGRLLLSDGRVLFVSSDNQGNAVLTSAIGSDTFLRIPAGSGPMPAGTVLEGFRI